MEIKTTLSQRKQTFLIKIFCLLIIFCFLFPPNSVLSVNTPSNYWSMDKIVGQTYGNPEIVSNDCIKNNCTNFNGLSKIVTTLNLNSKTDVQDNATYSFWFKTGSNVNNTQYLLTQNLNFTFPNSDVSEGRGVFIKDGEIGIFSRQTDYTWKEILLMTITTNSWYYLALVQNQSTLTGYINGTFEKSITFSGSMTSYSNSWGIACLTYRNYDLFSGKIDEITVYPTALSASDIIMMYDSYTTNNNNSSSQIDSRQTQITSQIDSKQTQITSQIDINQNQNSNLYIDLLLISTIVLVSVLIYIYKQKGTEQLNTTESLQSIKDIGTNSNRQLSINKNTCINCNNVIHKQDKFCEHCGCPIIIL